MKKADLYVGHLKREGFQPTVDGDGDVVFKSEGITYILSSEEKDRDFFSLWCPMFLIEGDEQRARVLAAAATVAAKVKVAKIGVVGDKVMACVEMLIDPIENFTRVFTRALGVLRAACGQFIELMDAGSK